MDFTRRLQVVLTFENQSISFLMLKNHLIISIDKKKTFDKIQPPFMIKPRKPRIDENFLKLIQGIYKNLQLTA